MNKFEQDSNNKEEVNSYFGEVEAIAFEVAEMLDFEEAAKEAKDELEVIRNARILLNNRFQEISELPKPLIVLKNYWRGAAIMEA